MSIPVVAGIDAGSTAIKITVYNGVRMESRIGSTGWSPRDAAGLLLQQAVREWDLEMTDLARVVGTGYGRVSLPYLTGSFTEIACHAKGAAWLYPQALTVIDIGGQDAKAILLRDNGKVQDFIMNDKCAAGTGRFLEVMANSLGMDISEMGQVTLPSEEEAYTINSMCTVFAESEVIGLLNRGCSRQAIVAGIYKSIAGRVVAMASRINPEPPIIFTGGVSRNYALRQVLEAELRMPVIVPDDAIFAGSIGAALYAWEELKNNKSREEM